MVLERCHAAENALVLKARDAPLDLFLDLRTAAVKKRSQLLEDRPGEWLCSLNVCIDLRGLLPHDAGKS
jgi:hypothetical protein